jgi:signal recognition particle subunit SRP54
VLETVTQGFKNATDRLRGVRELTEASIDEALRDVRLSLLEADVDLALTRSFLARVKERSLGAKVETKVRDRSGRQIRVTPGQHFIKICEEELAQLMGPVDPSLARSAGIVSVLLAGLQGVGKTTISAKLAVHLRKQGRKPLLVAADVYRPAAIDQLKTLGASIGVPVHAGEPGEQPPAICAAAFARAKREGFDAIVYDTAGRLAVDDALMVELEQIVAAVAPANKLLVCDALMGRDAVNVAKAFADRIALDGVILTKLDGDARGGAALSVKAVTGVPIKFLGTGETVDRLEEFRPEGLASRILGMGDIVGLVKDFEEVIDEKEAEADAARLLKGSFGLDDLLKQMRMIQKLGPLKDVFSKLPGIGQIADQLDDGELVKVESMIQSMTRGRAREALPDRQEPRPADRRRQRAKDLRGRAARRSLHADAKADGRARPAGRTALADVRWLPGRRRSVARRRGRDAAHGPARRPPGRHELRSLDAARRPRSGRRAAQAAGRQGQEKQAKAAARLAQEAPEEVTSSADRKPPHSPPHPSARPGPSL